MDFLLLANYFNALHWQQPNSEFLYFQYSLFIINRGGLLVEIEVP